MCRDVAELLEDMERMAGMDFETADDLREVLDDEQEAGSWEG